jgi:hypothetical protein
MVEFLERLLNGTSIDLPDSEVGGFAELAAFLGNTQPLNQLIDGLPLNQLTVGFRLPSKSVLGESVDQEISFAASHFYEFDLDDLKGIKVSILD